MLEKGHPAGSSRQAASLILQQTFSTDSPFRELHSGVFFIYLIRMGGWFASASQSLSEPLAQRQDASFRQRRLDLGTAVPPGQDETALPSVNEPCSRVIVYNHLFTQHSSAGQPCISSTDGLKTPGKPHVFSDLSTACKPSSFLSVMVHNLLLLPPLMVGTNNPKFPPAKRSEGFPSLGATPRLRFGESSRSHSSVCI